MKTVSIPYCVTSEERNKELFSQRMLKIFQGLNAKRVSLVFGGKWLDMENNVPLIAKAVKYFAKYNMEVAVWPNSFLHNDYGDKYTRKKYVDGTEQHTCPMDEDFLHDYGKKIAAYANTGVALIYLDDDFRIGVSGGLNCFCDLHMQEYKKILGEDVTREKMADEILSGKPSKYRDAWAKANGVALRKAARIIREEVDKVNPNVRVGVCAAPTTTFGFDGVTAFEISEILAGNTQPFLRTIGAPYWAYFGRDDFKARLSDVIGLERLEAFYAEQRGFKGELISEGDTYPRPRFSAPASFLELFHSALATENRMDGILKYLGEYTCDGTYEIAYSKLALKNKEKLDALVAAFENTQKVGFKIFEQQDKSKTMEILPEDIQSMQYQCTTLHASIRAFNDASIPYTFAGEEPVVVIGDNARYITKEDCKYGVFTDIVGAQILKERGFDVGFDGYGEKVTIDTCGEEYPSLKRGDYVVFKRNVEIFDLNLQANAEILTYTSIGKKQFPMLYRYEKDGFKIVVCCLDMTQSRYAYGLYASYDKQRVLADCYEWFKDEKMAAVCFDSPMVMPIVGKKDNKLVVGLWNIYEDEIFDHKITLGRKYSKVECIGCSGSLDGENFVLDSLKPYDFCAFVLE